MNASKEETVILITGGVGGICRSMAKFLLKAGYKVAVLDIEMYDFQEHLNGQLVSFRCDVRGQDQVEDAIGSIIEKWGRIDILVNGAAVAHYVTSMDNNQSTEEMDINFWGAVNVTRAVLPHMLAQERGFIHNMGSIMTSSGQRRLTGYLASKAALASFTHSLRKELNGTGVIVNMFYPPLTRTGLTKDSGMPENLMAEPEKVGVKLAKKIFSSSPEVYSDTTTRIQAFIIRLFPGLSSRIIDRIL